MSLFIVDFSISALPVTVNIIIVPAQKLEETQHTGQDPWDPHLIVLPCIHKRNYKAGWNNLSFLQANVQVLYDRSLSKPAGDTKETTSCHRHIPIYLSIFQVLYFSVEAHGNQIHIWDSNITMKRHNTIHSYCTDLNIGDFSCSRTS